MKQNDGHTLHVKDLSLNKQNTLKDQGFSIRVFHLQQDPPNANRIKISSPHLEAELLPSKGFSLGQAWIKGKPLFWEAPIELCDTENIDLWSDEVCINGCPAPGFTFLKTFVAGVELYGLKNWGMPVMAEGKQQLLHGETSNIPVSECQFLVNGDECTLQASFDYFSFDGKNILPWYRRGEALFRVKRKLILTKQAMGFTLQDTIENISNRVLTPDWGYHITFMPEAGSRLIVPSKYAEKRGHGALPCDFQTWHKATNENVRTETGIIHKNLQTSQIDNGSTAVRSLLIYPDHTGIEVLTTPAPYFQTWFCNGGKGSDEFTFRNGESLLRKNWDGMGIEIGSSALDHDGNIDKSVAYEPALKPGESKTIDLGFFWKNNISQT